MSPRAGDGLRSEADVIRALETGTYTLRQVYARCEDAGPTVVGRGRGGDTVQDGQARWQRRVRNALQQAKRSGRARQVERGLWAIEGTSAHPRRAQLLWLPRDPGRIELVLGEAAQILAQIDEPVDLVVADPPFGLGWGDSDPRTNISRRAYARNRDLVVPGYRDVDPGEYEEFTTRWVEAAAAALRPGGYLAAITGPERAPDVQIAARRAGLSYVNYCAAFRTFAMRTSRRFGHSHWVVSIVCKGPLASADRFFAVDSRLPKARNGTDYPLDVFDQRVIRKYERRGLLRYGNALPPDLVRLLVRSLSAIQALVVDPFLGSGTSALVCLEEGRRFVGGDVNEHSLRFTMARLLAEGSLRSGRDAGAPAQLALAV